MKLLQKFTKATRKTKITIILIVVFALGLILGAGGYLALKAVNRSKIEQTTINSDSNSPQTSPNNEADLSVDQAQPPTIPDISLPTSPKIEVAKPTPLPVIAPIASKSIYKQFSGQQFVDFYNGTRYNNVTSIDTKPSITGDLAIDSYIQNAAEIRGYRLRAQSASNDSQPELITAVAGLKAAASNEASLNFVLVSGYRSVANQREIFLATIKQVGVNQSLITSGSENARLESVLVTRSIPGYSKHHTGFTVDFGCNGSDLLGFKNSACYEWISQNNFENAKRFGLIPSYPEGSANQGPDPEEWEFVWVGESNLKL